MLLDDAGEVERADLVHLRCGQAWEILNKAEKSERAFEQAGEAVDVRLKRMKSRELRRRYRALPHVVAILRRRPPLSPQGERAS